MVFLEVFDPTSFIGGAAVTALAFSVRSIRNRAQANSVSTKRDVLIAEFRPMYAEFEKNLADVDARIASFECDYAVAFPHGTLDSAVMKSVRDRTRGRLNEFLKTLNGLDAQRLTKADIKGYETRLKIHSADVESDMRNCVYLVSNHESKLSATVKTMASVEIAAKDIQDRLKRATADANDALARFDRLFTEKIPPALFAAEKACAKMTTDIENMSVKVNRAGAYFTSQSEIPSLGTASRSLTTLENHLEKAISYKETVLAETVKMRNSLLRAPNWGPNAQRDIDYEAALGSLIEAESRSYDAGNPKVEFEEIVQPYRTFMENTDQRVYRNR